MSSVSSDSPPPETTISVISTKRYSCVTCGRSFNRPDHLRRHMLSHSGSRPHACTETGCTMAFRTAYHLRRHIIRVHGEAALVCPLCKASFRKQHQLCEHMTRTHADAIAATPLGVDCSPEVFTTGLSRRDLAHLCRTCPACHRTCAEPSELVSHAKVHGAKFLQEVDAALGPNLRGRTRSQSVTPARSLAASEDE